MKIKVKNVILTGVIFGVLLSFMTDYIKLKKKESDVYGTIIIEDTLCWAKNGSPVHECYKCHTIIFPDDWYTIISVDGERLWVCEHCRTYNPKED